MLAVENSIRKRTAHAQPRRRTVARAVRPAPMTSTRPRKHAGLHEKNEDVEILRGHEADVPVEIDPTLEASENERQRYDSNSALNLYLSEIAKTSLLTTEEEIELARRIKKGDRQAREKMIKANLRLVVKIARDYENYGMPLLDLINEGNIGLMKGVERFDPTKGAKFSTYGAWWIKQSVKRALANQSKTIRLPVHVVDKVAHIRRASLKLQEIFGREPSDEELSEELGISRRRVAQYRAAAVAPTSLDASLGDDDSNRIADVVEDERAETPYQELEEKTNTQLVREMLEKLDERESTILALRFNLNGEREETLEEIGQRFGVTRERIRQIQEIALGKLRKMIEKLEFPTPPVPEEK